MVVIAGPSGSGTSRHFPAASFGIASFNVDDRCAALNGGSYHATPVSVRVQAQRECERFIEECTRSQIAIEQAVRAQRVGFTAKMVFVATDDVHDNIQRIVRRALDGGHSAPASRIREI